MLRWFRKLWANLLLRQATDRLGNAFDVALRSGFSEVEAYPRALQFALRQRYAPDTLAHAEELERMWTEIRPLLEAELGTKRVHESINALVGAQFRAAAWLSRLRDSGLVPKDASRPEMQEALYRLLSRFPLSQYPSYREEIVEAVLGFAGFEEGDAGKQLLRLLRAAQKRAVL